MNLSIRKLSFVCLAICAICACGGKSENPNLPATPKLLLTLDNSSVNISQSTTLNLEFRDISEPVFGISLQLDYDDSILSYDDSTAFDAGDFFGDDILQFSRDTNSAVHLSITRLQGQDGVTGSGVLAVLNFVGTRSGACTFEISRENLNLYDSDGNTIDISTLEISSAELHVN